MARNKVSQGTPRAQALRRAEADRVSAGRQKAASVDDDARDEVQGADVSAAASAAVKTGASRTGTARQDAARAQAARADAARDAVPAEAGPADAGVADAAQADVAHADESHAHDAHTQGGHANGAHGNAAHAAAGRADVSRAAEARHADTLRGDVGRQEAVRHGHGRVTEAAPAHADHGSGGSADRALRAMRLRGPGTATRRRVVLVVLVLVLQAVAVWWAFFRNTDTLETMTVQRTGIESTVSALGTLQPQRYVDVGAQVSGQISRILVQPGDNVAKGDLLVEFDPSIQQAEVDTDRATLQSLRAQLAERQAELTLAQQKVNRQRRMAADGSTRMEDFQTAEANLKIAQARVQSLTAQIEGAASRLKGSEAKLGHTRIYAPMSGTVVTLDAREGQTLNAAYQTPVVMRIADLSRMTVWAEVSEADIGRVKVDMPVYFTTMGLMDAQGQPRRWESTLRQVLPAPPNKPVTAAAGAGGQEGAQPASGKVVAYTALFDVDNADGALMPQMTARVFFVSAAASHALVVPLAALKPTADRNTFEAQVLENGSQRQRTVKVGVRDRLQAEVVSGLNEGDVLVTGVKPAEDSEKVRW
jgi:efflux transporter, RND family, MFP subunit